MARHDVAAGILPPDSRSDMVWEAFVRLKETFRAIGSFGGKMTTADITPAQCRAARALLRWSQKELARESRVGEITIVHFETEKTAPVPGTLMLLRHTFEAAGIQFIEEDGGGEGVRFAKRRRPKPPAAKTGPRKGAR
jgi:DNA-binding XRE family transcriptional regulator